MIINFDIEFLKEQYSPYNIEDRKGLYFLYNENNELLYIGWTTYLKTRIREHITGHTNTKRFSGEIFKIKILYVESFKHIRNQFPKCEDIEYFLIEKLNPKYNIMRSKKSAYSI